MSIFPINQDSPVRTESRGKYCHSVNIEFFVIFVISTKLKPHAGLNHFTLWNPSFLASVVTVWQLFTPTDLRPSTQFVSGPDSLPLRRAKL